jgi:hypothetical protein
VSCPPLSAGPIRIRDSSPQDVRDTMPADAALSIETGREAIVLEDTSVPFLGDAEHIHAARPKPRHALAFRLERRTTEA